MVLHQFKRLNDYVEREYFVGHAASLRVPTLEEDGAYAKSM
jgi:hypothetical protein